MRPFKCKRRSWFFRLLRSPQYARSMWILIGPEVPFWNRVHGVFLLVRELLRP